MTISYLVRLALPEIVIHAGDASAGRARFTALERDASAKACIGVAKRAAAINRP